MPLTLFVQGHLKKLAGLETQIDDIDGLEHLLSMEYGLCELRLMGTSFNRELLTSGEFK